MLENVKKHISAINRSANRLRNQIAVVSDRIAVLEKERSALLRLPVLKSDFSDAVCASIDIMAEQEGRQFSAYFSHQIEGGSPHAWGNPSAKNVLKMTEGSVLMLGLFSHQRIGIDPPTLPLLPAVFFFRDAIKKAMRESIDAVDWPFDNAKSIDQITERVAEIDQEIEQLEDELKELRAAAREIGIDVSDARLSVAQQSEETTAQD